MNTQLRPDYVIIVKFVEQWIVGYYPSPNGDMRTVVGNKGCDADGVLWKFHYDTYTFANGMTQIGSSYGFNRA